MFYGHNPLGAEAGALQSSRLAWAISQGPASTDKHPSPQRKLFRVRKLWLSGG